MLKHQAKEDQTYTFTWLAVVLKWKKQLPNREALQHYKSWTNRKKSSLRKTKFSMTRWWNIKKSFSKPKRIKIVDLYFFHVILGNVISSKKFLWMHPRILNDLLVCTSNLEFQYQHQKMRIFLIKFTIIFCAGKNI